MDTLRIYSLPRSKFAPAHHAIYLVEGTPEALAMAQALHSRCAGSVVNLLHSNHGATLQPWPEDADAKQQAWINKWVVGFNHKSILNGTHVVLFLENIPLYQAQLLQAHPLYRGTEKSSRFVTMTGEASEIDRAAEEAASWFYDYCPEPAWESGLRSALRGSLASYQTTREYLTRTLVDGGVFDPLAPKAAAALASDLSRGLLPFATQTSLSLSVDLETLATLLATLRGRFDTQPLYYSLRTAVAAFSPNTLEQAASAEPIEVPSFCGEFAPAQPGLIHLADAEGNEQGLCSVAWLSLDYGSARDLYRHRSVKRYMAYGDVDASRVYRERVAFYCGEEAARQYELAWHAAKHEGTVFAAGRKPPRALRLATLPLSTATNVKLVGDTQALYAILQRRAQPDVHFSLRAAIGNLVDASDCCAELEELEQALAQETDWARRAKADIQLRQAEPEGGVGA